MLYFIFLCHRIDIICIVLILVLFVSVDLALLVSFLSPSLICFTCLASWWYVYRTSLYIVCSLLITCVCFYICWRMHFSFLFVCLCFLYCWYMLMFCLHCLLTCEGVSVFMSVFHLLSFSIYISKYRESFLLFFFFFFFYFCILFKAHVDEIVCFVCLTLLFINLPFCYWYA